MSQKQWFPWNGSKRWLLGDLGPVLDEWDGNGRFIDAFCGSGMVSRLARSKFSSSSQIVADANPWLMSMFSWQTCADKSLDHVHECKDVQYWRNLTDQSLSDLDWNKRSLRFLVCLLTAWGNRWETAPNGRFRSTVNEKYCEPDFLTNRIMDILSMPSWLRDDDIAVCQDWKKTVSLASPGDLVYLDPPYPESLGYGNQWWSFSDQLDVVDWTSEVIKKGVSVVVSNMSTLDRLYRRAGMEVKLVNGPKASLTKRQRVECIAWKIHK